MEIGDLTGSGLRCSDTLEIGEYWRDGDRSPPAPSGVSSIFLFLMDEGSVRGRPGEPAAPF